MLICLENILDSVRVKTIEDLLKKEELFESGKTTAGSRARRTKSNLQGRPDTPEISGVIKKVREALENNALFRAISVPGDIGRVLINRYEPDMKYGSHYDEPFIDGLRTDLSFTLFLSDPSSYAGGELEIDGASGKQAIKLPAGCAVIYPSNSLHGVLPVKKGTRLAAVGWIQSRIRSGEQRTLLFELTNIIKRLEELKTRELEITELKNLRNNLLRMWADS